MSACATTTVSQDIPTVVILTQTMARATMAAPGATSADASTATTAQTVAGAVFPRDYQKAVSARILAAMQMTGHARTTWLACAESARIAPIVGCAAALSHRRRHLRYHHPRRRVRRRHAVLLLHPRRPHFRRDARAAIVASPLTMAFATTAAQARSTTTAARAGTAQTAGCAAATAAASAPTIAATMRITRATMVGWTRITTFARSAATAGIAGGVATPDQTPSVNRRVPR